MSEVNFLSNNNSAALNTIAYGDRQLSDFTIIKENPQGKSTRFLVHRYELMRSSASRLLHALMDAEPQSASITLPSDSPVTSGECAVFLECLYERDVSKWVTTICFFDLAKAQLYFDSTFVHNVVQSHYEDMTNNIGLSLIESAHFFIDCRLGNSVKIIDDFLERIMATSTIHVRATASYTITKIAEMECGQFTNTLCAHRFIQPGASVKNIISRFFSEAQWPLIESLINKKLRNLSVNARGAGATYTCVEHLITI